MKKELTVIIPCYNEDPKVLKVIVKILINHKIKTIVVNDGSDYFPWKKFYGATVVSRKKNKGSGNATKLGMKYAKTPYVARLDADAQYDPLDLIDMWESMEDEDMIIGKRICHHGGWKRLLGRMFMKIVSSIVALRYIPDLNSGSRIFKKRIAMAYASILCDEFSFVSSLTLCFIMGKYKVKWVPIGFYPRKGTQSTVRLVRHGLMSLFQIFRLGVGLRTRRFRAWLRGK